MLRPGYELMSGARDLMNLLSEDFFEPVKYGTGFGKVMRTDVRETEDSYILDIELPGFKKEDIKAELKDGILVISAKKDESNVEKNKDGKVIHSERCTGACSRSFYVGEDIQITDISAKFENGELTITYPKEKKEIEKKETVINID